MRRPKVAVVVGSIRRESYNRKLALALGKLASPKLEFALVGIDDLPLYNQDLDGDLPSQVVRFKGEIAAADAVLFVTPEHNRSIPAALKNAIDWGNRPYGRNSWSGKLCGIVGTSPGAIATAVAQEHLRHIAVTQGMVVMGQPEVYLNYKEGLIEGTGNVPDENVRKFLQGYVQRFAEWIERMAIKEAQFA